MKNIFYLLTVVVLVGGVLFTYNNVTANPEYFATMVETSSATTSPTFMTPGTATTTLTYDTFANGTTYAPTKAYLLVQLVASTTDTVLNIDFEHSQDGAEWWQDHLVTPATTTGQTVVGTPNSTSWTFASSSENGQPVGATSDRVTKMFTMPVPLRHARAVFTVTGGNATVWAQIVPVKEQ